MIRLFIGWDSRETVAWHVLAHSIITRSTEPVSITPIGNSVLPGTDWYRQPGEHDSTEFSNARFMVPKLCNYEDWAIFMDCDMLCQADIADLWAQRDPERAVLVRKHDHQVEDGAPKFLGAHQTAYGRKNWSSLMLINCRHPKWATFDPNDAAGLDMHRFAFLEDEEIGEIKGDWNHLLYAGSYPPPAAPWESRQLVHFTEGGPWHGWAKYLEAEDWCAEFSDMLGGENPRAHVKAYLAQGGVLVGGSYTISPADAAAQDETL
jgi:hypothetical protein